MNNKKQQNTFISGMMLDSHPSTASDTMLTNCLNGTLITYGDNQYVLQNDLGNGKIYSDKQKQIPAKLPHELFFNKDSEDLTTATYSLCENLYRPVGIKEHNGILYIVSQNIKSRLYSEDETITLEVDSDSKYIITTKFTIESSSRDFDTLLPNYKVGFLVRKESSTELTVSEFLQKIQQDIDKIDFQKFRHLDDEKAIIYKGSEIGSFPSPQYERVNGVVSEQIQYTEKNPEKTYNCNLYLDGYKLEDQSLAFGDYLRLEVEDDNIETEVQLQDITELNSELKNNIPNIQRELFNLDILLSLDNVSTNITFSPNLIHQSNEVQTRENSYIIPQSQEGQLQLIFNESSLYNINSDDIIFYYNGDTDPVIYATGSINVLYNAPDGNGEVETNDFNFKLHSNTNHKTKTDLINYLAIKDKDQKFNLIKTNTEIKDNELDSYSRSKIVERNSNYYINREITLKQHPIIRIENLSDIKDIECNFWLLGSSKINEIIKEKLEQKFSKVIPVDRIIKDAISLFQFNYNFSKEINTFNYSITIIEPKLPYTNLKLYFDFIPITTAEFSEEKVIHTLILELNENDRLGTFRIFKDSIIVENLKGSYAVVFYAEVDGIVSYIDTQYYINYSDYTNLNYLLFRQDIYDNSKNTGRIINYYIDNIKYIPSVGEPGYLGWEGIYINNITINNKDYTYNYYIDDEIESIGSIKIQGLLECNALNGDRTKLLPVIYEEGTKIVNNRFRNSSVNLSTPKIKSNLVDTEEYSAEPIPVSETKVAYQITINNPQYKINQVKVRDESFYRFIKRSDIITITLNIDCKKDHDRYNRFKFLADTPKGTVRLFSNRDSDSSGFIDLTQWCQQKTCPLYAGSTGSVTDLSINYSAILSELSKNGIINNNIVLVISFNKGTSSPTYSYISGNSIFISYIPTSDYTKVINMRPIWDTFISGKYIVREEGNENYTTKKSISFYNTSLKTEISREVTDFIKIEDKNYNTVITKTQNDIKNNPRYNIGDKNISYINSDFIKSECLNKTVSQEFFVEYCLIINPEYTGIIDFFYDSTYSKNIYSYIQYDYSNGNYETLINYIKLQSIDSTNKLLLYYKGKLYSLTTGSGSSLTRYKIEGNELIEPSTEKTPERLNLIRNIIDGGQGSSQDIGGQIHYGSTISLNPNYNQLYYLDPTNKYQYVFNLALNI